MPALSSLLAGKHAFDEILAVLQDYSLNSSIDSGTVLQILDNNAVDTDTLHMAYAHMQKGFLLQIRRSNLRDSMDYLRTMNGIAQRISRFENHASLSIDALTQIKNDLIHAHKNADVSLLERTLDCVKLYVETENPKAFGKNGRASGYHFSEYGGEIFPNEYLHMFEVNPQTLAIQPNFVCRSLRPFDVVLIESQQEFEGHLLEYDAGLMRLEAICRRKNIPVRTYHSKGRYDLQKDGYFVDCDTAEIKNVDETFAFGKTGKTRVMIVGGTLMYEKETALPIIRLGITRESISNYDQSDSSRKFAFVHGCVADTTAALRRTGNCEVFIDTQAVVSDESRFDANVLYSPYLYDISPQLSRTVLLTKLARVGNN